MSNILRKPNVLQYKENKWIWMLMMSKYWTGAKILEAVFNDELLEEFAVSRSNDAGLPTKKEMYNIPLDKACKIELRKCKPFGLSTSATEQYSFKCYIDFQLSIVPCYRREPSVHIFPKQKLRPFLDVDT